MRTGNLKILKGHFVMHLVARRGILSPGWIITYTISSRYRRSNACTVQHRRANLQLDHTSVHEDFKRLHLNVKISENGKKSKLG